MSTIKQLSVLIPKDLTQVQTALGLPETKVIKYNETETSIIKSELFRYATAKQEKIPPPVINEWLQTFQEMSISPKELVMRIRIAKNRKRYGTQTTLADFMDLEEDYYRNYYLNYKRIT